MAEPVRRPRTASEAKQLRAIRRRIDTRLTKAQKSVEALRKEFDGMLKDLEAVDKLGNFEIQANPPPKPKPKPKPKPPAS
jgi:hypothetical protein